MSGALFDLIAVHCCWCAHVVRSVDPQTAHDGMEAHYATDHRMIIDSLVGATR
jgi:hypothetical protein